MAPVQRVVLTGFMGAGKSTVGPLLASLLGWQFYDVDHVLAAQAGLPVAGIFAAHGEAHFRHLEATTIAALLTQPRAVVALGGGALEREDTCQRLAGSPQTLLVYLESSLAVALSRCRVTPEAHARPVLQDPALEARFASRLPAYRRAHLTVNTESLAPESVAAHIVEAVRRPAL